MILRPSRRLSRTDNSTVMLETVSLFSSTLTELRSPDPSSSFYSLGKAALSHHSPVEDHEEPPRRWKRHGRSLLWYVRSDERFFETHRLTALLSDRQERLSTLRSESTRPLPAAAPPLTSR